MPSLRLPDASDSTSISRIACITCESRCLRPTAFVIRLSSSSCVCWYAASFARRATISVISYRFISCSYPLSSTEHDVLRFSIPSLPQPSYSSPCDAIRFSAPIRGGKIARRGAPGVEARHRSGAGAEMPKQRWRSMSTRSASQLYRALSDEVGRTSRDRRARDVHGGIHSCRRRRRRRARRTALTRACWRSSWCDRHLSTAHQWLA